MGPAGRAAGRQKNPAANDSDRHEIRFRDVRFAYPLAASPGLEGLTARPGRASSNRRQERAGKTTLAKRCTALRPSGWRHQGDGIDRARSDRGWRRRGHRGVQDSSASSTAARQRGRGARTTDHRRVEAAAPTPGHRHPVAGLPGRHRPVGRPVAAGGAREGAVCGADGRRPRAAGRTHRPAGRAGRGRDLRAHPGGHPRLHDDPRVAPVLDGPPRRPHLRARGGAGGRAGQPRRADGAGRTVRHDVRAASVPVPHGAALGREEEVLDVL